MCPTSPIGICEVPGGVAPHYGYTPGNWIASAFTNAGGSAGFSASAVCNPAIYPGCAPAGGYFRWIDYSGLRSAGAVCALLNGTESVCDVKVGDTVYVQGQKQGAKDAYNGRFGIYSPGGGTCAPSPAANPPDRTGYAYPTKVPGTVINIGMDAYGSYRAKQGSLSDFVLGEYNNSNPTTNPTPPLPNPLGGAGGNLLPPPTNATPAERQAGGDRRLFAAPFIDCSGGTNSTPVINAMGCFLLLNPMSNGASGYVFVQYLGLTSQANSPCRASGFAGGPASTGPQVPTLVQ